MTLKNPERETGITQAVADSIQRVASSGINLEDLTVDTSGPINVWRVHSTPRAPRIEVRGSGLIYSCVNVFIDIDRDRKVLVWEGESSELDEIDLDACAQLGKNEVVVPMFCAIIEQTPTGPIARPAVLAKERGLSRQYSPTVRPLVISEDDTAQVVAATKLMAQMTEILHTGTVSFQGQEFRDPNAAPGVVFKGGSNEI